MKYLFVLLFFSVKSYGQDVSGVWTGYMYNDTTGQKIYYELAINNMKEKGDGYSHTTFIIDGIKKTGVKSVTIKAKEGHYYVADDRYIYNDFPEPPAKGVKMFSFLTLSENDSAQVLSGIWRTNPTKVYMPLTGTIFLEKKKNVKPEETIIVGELVHLGLGDKLDFLPASVAAGMLALDNKTAIPKKTVVSNQASPVNKNAAKQKPAAAVATVAVILPPPPPAAELANRTIENIRVVNIVKDSLVFSLFDNGTVDGDTVSVLLNGQVVMPRVGLLERATNKTIYLTPDMGDTINVIMYAENLGSIPPNTGLLVIRDGEKNYEIFFTGDLKKNAEIKLVRQKRN